MRIFQLFSILIFWSWVAESYFEKELCAQLVSIIDSKQPSLEQAASIRRLLLTHNVRCKAYDMLSDSLMDEVAQQESLFQVDFIKSDGVLTLSVRKGYIYSAAAYSLQEYARLRAVQNHLARVKESISI